MPWNAPQDYAEQFARELAEYLRQRGDRTQSEIDRTYETCRDFAQFLGKDIHDASSKDYTTFKRRRVLTVHDEDAYQQMLDDIKAFCQTTPRRNFAPVQDEPIERRKVSTSRIQPSEEIMAFLLSPDGSAPPEPDPNPTPMRQATDPNSTRLQADKKRRGSIQFPTDPDSANEITSLPSQSNDLHVKDLFEDAKLQRPKNAEQATRAYAIDLDQAPPLDYPKPPSASLANIPASFLGSGKSNGDDADDDNFSAFFSPSIDDDKGKFENRRNFANLDSSQSNPSVDKYDDSARRFGLQNDDDIARQVAQNDMSEEFLAKGASPANNELLRGVSGVDYDFNQANLEIIRRGELNKVKHAQNSGVSPIDESLIYSNFRPYTVDDKYLIDIPNPDPALYQIYPYAYIFHVHIPVIPILISIAIVIFGLAIDTIVGLVFVGLAIISAVVNRTAILPPTHHTPVATANAFFTAQATRAYTIALDLCAIPKDTEPDIDLPTIWQAVVPTWKQTILNRIHPKREIETRIVAGSDVQNSVVVLCTKGDDYWLLPLVRIKDLWYTTSVDLPIHTIKAEESKQSPF